MRKYLPTFPGMLAPFGWFYSQFCKYVPCFPMPTKWGYLFLSCSLNMLPAVFTYGHFIHPSKLILNVLFLKNSSPTCLLHPPLTSCMLHIWMMLFKITQFYLARCFSGVSGGKGSACNVGDWVSIPGSGKSPGEGNGTHSSLLAWRIPWTEETGGLQFMGLQRFRHNWATNTFTFHFPFFLGDGKHLQGKASSLLCPVACSVPCNRYISLIMSQFK